MEGPPGEAMLSFLTWVFVKTTQEVGGACIPGELGQQSRLSDGLPAFSALSHVAGKVILS